jgi:starch-binding outer membrane protein SusE/F
MVNSDWGTTYGFNSLSGPSGATWQSGIAGPGGSNIPGVAGFCNVSYNLTSGAYSFTPGANPNATINITGPGLTTPLITTNGVNYTLRSVTFLTAGTFLFSQAGSPNQWGNAAFPSGNATPGGAGVNVPLGTYNITFDKSSGAYAFTQTAVGLIGAGSPSGNWGADATMNTTDAVTYTLNNVTLTGGGFKIRDNQDWTYEFGCNGPQFTNAWPAGNMIANGTDMLSITGTYNITFNRSTGAYNFEDVSLANTIFKSANFIVSPNPTNSIWNFTSSKDAISSIQIIDILGKFVLTTNQTSIDASNLNSGIYFAKITANTSTETVKLVKN